MKKTSLYFASENTYCCLMKRFLKVTNDGVGSDRRPEIKNIFKYTLIIWNFSPGHNNPHEWNCLWKNILSFFSSGWDLISGKVRGHQRYPRALHRTNTTCEENTCDAHVTNQAFYPKHSKSRWCIFRAKRSRMMAIYALTTGVTIRIIVRKVLTWA